jgi:hypothetical protein
VPQSQLRSSVRPSAPPYSREAYAEAAALESPPAYEPRPFDVESFGPEEEAEEDADETLEPERKLALLDRARRVSPGAVILGIAAIGSAGFLIAQVLSHTSPIPVLTSAGVITGLIYAVITVAAGVASYQAASDGLMGRSYVLALLGGVAAIVACGSFAGALVLFLALGF